jgi:copper homeostasis protein CutC
VIEKLVKQSKGKISIMAGSGVNAENIEQLYKIGVREFHSSAATKNISNQSVPIAETEKIKAMKQILSAFVSLR